MNPEIGNHSKGEHPVYQIVPQLMQELLEQLRVIDGFVIGGSYASGRYKDGDDVDFDVLFATYPPALDRRILYREIERSFKTRGFVAEIRAPLARLILPERMRKTLYSEHPNSPFVVRDISIARDWGLSLD